MKIAYMAFRPNSKNPCKQYIFESKEDFEKWLNRKPYIYEVISYIEIKDNREIRRSFFSPRAY